MTFCIPVDISWESMMTCSGTLTFGLHLSALTIATLHARTGQHQMYTKQEVPCIPVGHRSNNNNNNNNNNSSASFGGGGNARINKFFRFFIFFEWARHNQGNAGC